MIELGALALLLRLMNLGGRRWLRRRLDGILATLSCVQVRPVVREGAPASPRRAA
jgi:hypothetical protein